MMTSPSNFFEEIQGMSPYLKAGIYGTEGSGKTFTMSLIAIGLHRHIKSQKPIVMFDSEGGSDYLLPLFTAANIKLLVKKARSLADLGQALTEAQKISDILLIDSLTHPYQELIFAYRKNKKGGGYFIDMRDWGPIKDEWRSRFAFPYVRSPLHIIWCARSKNIYEDIFDEEATQDARGQEKFKPVVVGTGAKAETESAYEPSLLFEMGKVYAGKVTKRGAKKTGAYKIKMTVQKDRANVIMGQSWEFDILDTKALLKSCKPFEAILPHVETIMQGGKAIDFSDRTSEGIFDQDNSVARIRARRKKAIETIESAVKAIFGQGKDPLKAAALEKIFGALSLVELENHDPDALESGIEHLRALYRYQQTDELSSVEKVRTALSFLTGDDSEQQEQDLAKVAGG